LFGFLMNVVLKDSRAKQVAFIAGRITSPQESRVVADDPG